MRTVKIIRKLQSKSEKGVKQISVASDKSPTHGYAEKTELKIESHKGDG